MDTIETGQSDLFGTSTALSVVGGEQADMPFSPDFSKRVETLCKHRDKALALYMEAYDLMQLARAEKSKAAPFNVYSQGLKDVAGKMGRHPQGERDRDEKKRAEEAAKYRADYLAETRKQVDSAVWRQIITETPLEKLMDTQARNDFHNQIETDPPEVTVDNCLATMTQLVLDADKIFVRGLVEAFRNLDYRYKSNDAFRIKSRFVMPNARDSDTKYFKENRGLSWNYRSEARSRLSDIERCLHILDGHSQWDSGEVIHAIDMASKRREFVAETDYFKCRSFKNGSLHVYFLRRDLITKANKLIAQHFGANVLADNRHASDPLRANGKRQKHAPDLGDFQSPAAVAQRVIALAQINKDHRVLEPSAGLGNIASLAAAITEEVTCVEIDANRAAALIYADKYEIVRHEDFLEMETNWRFDFDRVVMNPPFAKGAAIRHVVKAFDCLKQGGRLVAVMPAAIKWRKDQLHESFRAMIAKHGGTIEDLPDGSFKEAGTMVPTVIVTINRTSRW
jgi:predicted RNA methylase